MPCIVVEGIDDIAIYSQLAQSIPLDAEVYAIEQVKGYSEGCEQLIKAIETLYQLPQDHYQIAAHILGIIDKDVRDFRNELPSVEAILILKYYSIESHFVSAEVIEYILRNQNSIKSQSNAGC